MIRSFCPPELLPCTQLKANSEFLERTAIMLLMLLLILATATYGTCQSNTKDVSQDAAPSVVINTSGYTDQLVDCSKCKFKPFSPSLLGC